MTLICCGWDRTSSGGVNAIHFCIVEGIQSSQVPIILSMSFFRLADEPESKKLVAQSGLDSVKALLEFILLIYTPFTF